jgi:hypothetical protein
MAGFERVAVTYFVSLALAAFATRARWPRRLGVSALAVTIATTIVVVATTAPHPARVVAAHAWLVLGYWVPALLAPRQIGNSTPFEQRLLATDAWFRRRLPAVPRPLVLPMELAYLFCYPLVPAALVVAWMRGTPEDVDRFWVAVLIAGYASYGSIPWLVSRPPRLAQDAPQTPHAISTLNRAVLGRVSHQLNTFPSGHVSVSCAAAAMLLPVSAVAAAIVGIIAAGVALGAAAGRYHYVIDVVLGVAVAAVAAALALLDS